MLSPQCIPARPVGCWGSASVEEASRVVLEEQEVMVVVEPVVEEKWWEESYIGASTPVEVHSTEAVVGHVSETMSSGLSMVLRWIRPRRRCSPGRMSRGTLRRHVSRLVGAIISLGCPLHPLLVRSGSMRPPLVEEVERFSGCLSSLVHGFESRQGWALVCGVVLLTNETYLY